MTTLCDLIARLERAKAGSREFDSEIAVAIFETQKTDDDLIYARECARSDNCAPGTYWHVQRSGMSLRTASSYTTSLDAALTLVPRALWIIGHQEDCFARILPPVGDSYIGSKEISVTAHTPPLAVCIAALKAREAAR